MEIQSVKFDCRHFKGHIPCKPNKQHGYMCDACPAYAPVDKRILIVKLGAIGDVIRTTPLVARYRALYPCCHITWLTYSPEVLPKDSVDEILRFDFAAAYGVLHRQFDIAINLDKEVEACSLLADVSAKEKYGYTWRDCHIAAATPAAEHKLLTGFFDDLSKQNTKHYMDEIFEICHQKFNDEPYLLNLDKSLVERFEYVKLQAKGKKIVGLNTGCGGRWKTRLWPQEYWISLVEILQRQGCYPMLLGGRAEHEENAAMSKKSGAFYPGHFSLEEFIALTSCCDAIVTQVSMMMHIATALQKPMALMNNIFNASEFYLYHRGVIVQPSTGCDCFYGATCTRTRRCMLDITPQAVADGLNQVLPQK
ncbi:MAG: glycosyltransferase family 9 protein [Prevotellaceae bacterium]|nr:glycosyltransferase family 9 protein [Prevotellaceae bacterium]